METPVLTQSQKSKALSGNKSKQKKKSKIRNVLTNTTRSSCIKLSEQDSITFEEKLSEIFQCTIPKKPKWDVVKNIPKEKRPEFRAKLRKPKKNPLMCHLIFGINEVTRSIEKQTCTLVLISNDINPAILTRHIHEGCNTHQIPLFEISDLRTIAQNCFGFPTIAMAFKYIPDDLIMIKEFFVTLAPEIIPHINNNKNKNNNNKNSDNKPCEILQKPFGKKQIETIAKTNEVYLFRDSQDSRCFVPPTSAVKHLEENVQESRNVMDFIELGSDEEPEQIETKKQLYKKLKVKRIRPNPNRLKGKKKV